LHTTTAAQTLPDPLITSDPEWVGGTPCFTGTRVPVKTSFDYLEAGDPLDEFLEQVPDVSREHAVAVIKLAGRRVLPGAEAACGVEQANAARRLRSGRLPPRHRRPRGKDSALRRPLQAEQRRALECHVRPLRVLDTSDTNQRYQQRLTGSAVAIVAMRARRNRLEDLSRFVWLRQQTLLRFSC
jgi:uncharacterized protein (DUF433 family)